MNKYKKRFDKESNDVIAHTIADVSNENKFKAECSMGYFLTNVFLKYHQREWENSALSKKSLKPSISVMHASGIRSTFRKGCGFICSKRIF